MGNNLFVGKRTFLGCKFVGKRTFFGGVFIGKRTFFVEKYYICA